MSYDIGLTTADRTASLASLGACPKVTGPEKVANRVARLLLQEPGSVPQSSDGTRFLSWIRNGLASESNIFQAGAVASVQVKRILATVESSSDPDNERFSSLRVANVRIASGQLGVTIEVRTADGTRRSFDLSLDFLV